MEFQGQSILIKDISKLNLRKEVIVQAKELIKQLEFPVVFWVNAETDKNYTMCHPMNPNQYWITIIAGTKQEEMERLILAGLFKQVQLRKRYANAVPKKRYLLDLEVRKDDKAFKRMSDLVGEINSFASTLECELYLEQFGIYTSEEAKREKFRHYKEGLLEYIYIQQSQPYYCWYQENEASNLIGYAACCRFNQSYRNWFWKHILQVKPQKRALWYKSVLMQFEKIIEETRVKYDYTNGEMIVNWLRKEIVDILHLKSVISIEIQDAFRSDIEVKGNRVIIYSFIPDDFKDGEFVVSSVRSVNECLGLLRECVDYDRNYPYAKVSLSYSQGNNVSTFADDSGQYYVLLYVDFLERLKKAVEEFQLEERVGYIEKIKGSDYVRSILFRYTLFYISLHEYGHIFNGDCNLLNDETYEERVKKEKRADEFADHHFRTILLLQYRQNSLHESLTHSLEDEVFNLEAKRIAQAMREKSYE